jgi:DNA-binding transcriptional ArsR family regulator
VVHSTPILDYDAPDMFVVTEPAQLRALGDDLRIRIVGLLRERAASASELGELLGTPKGTVGHHLHVLERAGLVRVVRTRKVRAVTEKYYGRVGRVFLIQSQDELVHGVAAASFGVVAAELGASAEIAMNGHLRVRLAPADARRFNRRLDKLLEDARAAEVPDGQTWGVATALYRLGSS